jgi:hypothetical protein
MRYRRIAGHCHTVKRPVLPRAHAVRTRTSWAFFIPIRKLTTDYCLCTDFAPRVIKPSNLSTTVLIQMFTTALLTPNRAQRVPRFYPTFREFCAGAQPVTKPCRFSVDSVSSPGSTNIRSQMLLRSRLRSLRCLLFNCRLCPSSFRTPVPCPLTPRKGTHSVHCTDQKRPFFPTNLTPQAPPRYTHSPNAPHCTCALKPKNPHFPRETALSRSSPLAPRSSTRYIHPFAHPSLINQKPLFSPRNTHLTSIPY